MPKTIYGVYAHDRDSGDWLMDERFYQEEENAVARLEEFRAVKQKALDERRQYDNERNSCYRLGKCIPPLPERYYCVWPDWYHIEEFELV